ncbi:DsrE family protein [Deinococcus sp. Marseille-Q6407]|uniref:DsrE family protein n=1 Tax=Deinococcus sp. Marseille-Q6407 TaxID=2969223 RepID=UPI0021C1FE87|nr:DsrE family protein [Deinococcus sp. Marseille-Q6407]
MSSSEAALKVVLHVSDPANLNHALANAENLWAARPGAAARLVLNGQAVTALQGHNKVTARLAAATRQGLEVQACHNALEAYEIDQASLPSGVTVVPAGVVALAEAQAAGFAYIRV